MNPTTSYGTWVNHGDTGNVTVEATIADYLNGGPADWRQRVESSGAADRIAAAYREAINDALPEGVTLAGNEFYGPHESYAEVAVDIAEVVESVDLGAIVDRHDPDTDMGPWDDPAACTDRQLAVRLLAGREWNPAENDHTAELYRRHHRLDGMYAARRAALPVLPEDHDPLGDLGTDDEAAEAAHKRIIALMEAEVTAIRDRA